MTDQYVSDFFNNRVRAVTYSGPTLKFSNVTTNLSGIYSVVVSNLSGSVTSSVARLNVVLPPNLITQPKSQQIPVASNVTFSVSASGTEPLNYQWQFNGTNIAGATNNTFLIGVVTTNDAGNYSVTITNSYGRVASSNAALMVLAIPPSIATQPASQIVPSGSNALFTAVASGSPPFNYQWFFNGAPLNGQTSASLSLLNVTTNQAGAYSVQVASPFGSITSHIAILAVSGLPIITQQPANQSMLAGNRVLLNAGVSGLGPLTFQWQLNGTNLTNGFMTTVAGNGIPGYSGDGGIATTGMLNSPFGLAADGAGNFYFADSANNRIRKVDTGGVMTTVAGTGAPGFSGDGGAATNARLNSCYGVAIDGSGNLFIADTANNRIRKLDTNGIITTVAGRATSGFSGDGGPATNAALFGPYGVMVDATGDLFIADTSNYRVRKVEPNGIITTVAGKSSSGFSGDGGSATNASLFSPKGVAMDSEGNLIIADMDNQRVREVDVYGNISTLAGNGLANYSGDGGAATNASLLSPYAVAVDGYGDVLIADTGNNRIRRVDAYGKISTVAGTNAHGVLYAPSGITMDGYGRVLIADTGNSRIRRFGQGPTLVLDAANMTNAGNYTLVVNSSFGSITSAVATLTVLLPPSITIQPASQSIGLGSNGTFSVAATGTPPLSYLWQIDGVSQSAQTNQSLNFTNVQWSDAGSFRMVITNNYGSVTSRVATMTVGVPPSIVSQPSNQTVVAGSNGVLDVQAVGDGVFSYQWQFNGTNLPPVIATVAGNGTNGFSGDGGLATNAQISGPYGVAADKAGNVYISDYSNHRVRKVDANGIITTIAGTGTAGATGNGGPATNATLRAPQGMSLDGYGNLFFAEGNSDVRKVDTKGIITRVAGTTAVGYSLDGGQATNTALGQTTAVAVDGRGNLYLTDYYNFRIRKVDTNGIISTVAGANNGAGRSGYSGDGGPATNANLGQPTGVALDSLGGIVISDTDNYRVRAVNSSGIINTIAGGGSDGTSSGIPGTNANLKPINVAVDSWNNVFIACDNRVRMLDTNGIITTVAGGGSVRPGDFGPATSASLSAQAMAFDAQGNLLIADRSNLRIRKVWFSGLPTLLLPDASTNNAGNYSVVISSPFGSIASSMATVTVLLPPQHFAGQFGGGELQVHFSGTPNYPYILQSATNLMRPINWQPVVTNPADGNGNWQFADTNLNNGQKFYRVQMVP